MKTHKTKRDLKIAANKKLIYQLSDKVEVLERVMLEMISVMEEKGLIKIEEDK
ncbi:MAG: hypothetical protein R3213_05545 [Flavobacteriaceae bacterium]|nr:hypothetical protein [Flavobacteriaceae bacterium]